MEMEGCVSGRVKRIGSVELEFINENLQKSRGD